MHIKQFMEIIVKISLNTIKNIDLNQHESQINVIGTKY
jgi:hypothetical protein